MIEKLTFKTQFFMTDSVFGTKDSYESEFVFVYSYSSNLPYFTRIPNTAKKVEFVAYYSYSSNYSSNYFNDFFL